MLRVREFQSTDIQALAALMDDLGYPATAEAMKRRMETMNLDGEYVTFVAEFDGGVVGMVGVRKSLFYERDGVFVQVTALVTLSEYRHLGVGTALMNQAEIWAKEEGASTIYLTSGIKPERAEAHQFYKQLGYEITGYRFVKELEGNHG